MWGWIFELIKGFVYALLKLRRTEKDSVVDSGPRSALSPSESDVYRDLGMWDLNEVRDSASRQAPDGAGKSGSESATDR